MKRRILAAMLAASMAFSLAACGAGGESGGEGSGDDGEIYNINMHIPIFGTDMPALEDVENAINEIIEPEIGAKVTLLPVQAANMASEASLMISSGEDLDLMCILPYGAGLDSISNYTSKNMLLPLDDLYEEYGQDIAASVGDLIELGYSGGKLYAIPPNYLYGGGRAFVVRKDMLDEMGVTIDESKIYTVDDLEELFDTFKEHYGDGYYPIATFGSASTNMFTSLNSIDPLGTDTTDGVLMEVSEDAPLKVENLFETEEYEEHANLMYEWQQKGYFNPDAATITDDIASLVASGIYLGSFGATTAVDNGVMESRVGTELIQMTLDEPYGVSAAATCGLWAIPNTCDNPEKVMEFLNLMYQDRELDKDIDTILQWGVEGTCYDVVEVIDNSKAIIKYPDGVDASNVPWTAAGPIYGDQLTLPVLEPLTADAYDKYEQFNQQIVDSGRMSSAYGYVFDPQNVSSQKAAITSVVSQYVNTIEFGLADPAQSLPEFRQALKDAGIDEVIAENQKQLDEWAETKQ